MNGHEKFGFNQTPPENNAEQQAALERLRQGETTALLEFASSTLPKMERRRAGKISRLIALFSLASTLALKEHEPDAPASPESAELTVLVDKNLTHPASPNELDTLTKELVHSVTEHGATKGVGDLIYGNISTTDETEKGASDTEHVRGQLPERAQKVILRGGLITTINHGQTNDVVSFGSTHHHAFALSGVAHGFDVLPAGKEINFTGFGVSEKNALESGLEDAAGFFGKEVGVEQSLKSTVTDTGNKNTTRVVEKFDEDIRSRYGKAFHSYELTGKKKRSDGMWEVTLRVQPGQIIETDKPDDFKIIEKPKD
ncbi:MAG: hypothetical protein UX89_C0002G0074 [Parcubacteria group bacterium GW2011_GWA2_47_16]|nr:MAG: hypothetical protein UX89_C0002G0074 [Parcubacteria group bacterium GW2011_GWA2_47_16]